MKQIITLILISIFPENLHAQTSIWPDNPQYTHPELNIHRAFVNHTLRMQQRKAAFKTTAQAERVVAMSSLVWLNNDWHIRDTTKLFYSGSNGSTFDFNLMSFNYEIYLGLNYTMYPYSWSTIPTMADSVAYFLNDDPGDPMYLFNVVTNAYNSSDQLLVHKKQEYLLGNPASGQLIDYVYDAQDRRIRMTVFEVNGSSLDTVAVIHTSYDAQSRRTADTIHAYHNGSLTPSWAYHYSYDSNDNITKIEVDESGPNGWKPFDKIENTFYNDNRLKTSTDFADMGSGLEPYLLDSLGYTGPVPFPTFYRSSNLLGGINTPQQGYSHKLNSQNLPDTTIVFFSSQTPGVLEEIGFIKMEYTSMGNPIQATTHQAIPPNTFEPMYRNRYYYETYTTGAENTPKKSDVVVYPNPVDGQVNIDLKDQNAQVVNIELVNAAGQRVLTGKVPVNSGKAQLSTQTLTPGMYWMQVRGENGAVLHSQTVVKQ